MTNKELLECIRIVKRDNISEVNFKKLLNITNNYGDIKSIISKEEIKDDYIIKALVNLLNKENKEWLLKSYINNEFSFKDNYIYQYIRKNNYSLYFLNQFIIWQITDNTKKEGFLFKNYIPLVLAGEDIDEQQLRLYYFKLENGNIKDYKIVREYILDSSVNIKNKWSLVHLLSGKHFILEDLKNRKYIDFLFKYNMFFCKNIMYLLNLLNLNIDVLPDDITSDEVTYINAIFMFLRNNYDELAIKSFFKTKNYTRDLLFNNSIPLNKRWDYFNLINNKIFMKERLVKLVIKAYDYDESFKRASIIARCLSNRGISHNPYCINLIEKYIEENNNPELLKSIHEVLKINGVRKDTQSLEKLKDMNYDELITLKNKWYKNGKTKTKGISDIEKELLESYQKFLAGLVDMNILEKNLEHGEDLGLELTLLPDSNTKSK